MFIRSKSPPLSFSNSKQKKMSEFPNLNTAIPGQNQIPPLQGIPLPNVPQIPTQNPPSLNTGIPQINNIQIPTKITPPGSFDSINQLGTQIPTPSTFVIPESNLKTQNTSNSFPQLNVMVPVSLNLKVPSADISISNFPKHTTIQSNKSTHYSSQNNKTSLKDFIKSQEVSPNTEVILDDTELTESFPLAKQILLTGRSEKNTLIISNGRDNTLSIKTSIGQVKNITFKQTDSQACGALLVESGDVLFENCSFISNLMPSVIIKGQSQVFFVNCKFTCPNSTCLIAGQNSFVSFSSCKFESSLFGCSLKQTSRALFSNCTFSQIQQNSISCLNQALVVCDDSTFVSCTGQCVDIKTSVSTPCGIRRCNFKDCANAIKVTDSQFVLTSTKIQKSSGSVLEVKGQRAAVSSSYNEYLLNTQSTSGNNTGSSILLYGGASFVSNKDVFTGTTDAVLTAFGDETKFELEQPTLKSITGLCFLFYNNSKGLIKQATIQDVSNNALVCHSQAKVAISDSTIQNVNGKCIAYLKETQDCHFINTSFTLSEKTCIVAENTNDQVIFFDRCTFNGNKETCISSSASNVIVSQSTFTNNYSAIDSRNSTIQILKTKFAGNTLGVNLSQSNSKMDSLELNKNANSLVLEGGTCDFTKSTISECSGFSFYATSEANCKCAGVSILNSTSENPSVAITGSKTNVTFNDTTFINNPVHLSVGDYAVCNLERCKLSAGTLQIDASKGCTIGAKSVEFIDCKGQAAIHIHDNANCSFERCTITNCAEVGIICSGKMKLDHSQMVSSRKLGVYLTGDANCRIESSVLQSNGDCGIYAANGSLTCIANRITNHKYVGLKIGVDATTEVRENDISSNGVLNVERE